jgi:hypothetical protein
MSLSLFLSRRVVRIARIARIASYRLAHEPES